MHSKLMQNFKLINYSIVDVRILMLCNVDTPLLIFFHLTLKLLTLPLRKSIQY